MLLDGGEKVRQVTCRGASEEMHAFDDWMADEEAKVREGAASIGDICAEQVVSMLNFAPAAAEPEKQVVGAIGG